MASSHPTVAAVSPDCQEVRAAPDLFWLGLGAGTAAWVAGVVLLRVTTAPVTWALCHITWHVVPAMAGANLLLRGASISTGQHISL